VILKFPDAKCNITCHYIILAFLPVQKLNICGNVSDRAVNIIDQNNFSGWVLVNKKERRTYMNFFIFCV